MFAHETHEAMTDPAWEDAQDEAFFEARDSAQDGDADPVSVPEWVFLAPTAHERAEFERMLDFDAWEGFGN